MKIFGKAKRVGERFIAIFDIASASVGGAFVRLDPEKPPQVVLTVREDIPFQEKIQFPRFLDATRKTLESVFVAMHKAGGGVAIEDAFCILSSPWYASQTRLIQYDRSEPFIVTKKGIERLLTRETELFQESKIFQRSRVDDKPPVIIESKVIQIKLNGYPVTMPIGKHAKLLEIALYLSVTPENIHRIIRESITKFWHVPEVRFSSFSLTAFDVIRDLFPEENGFLFMDISGEVTDLSLSRDGVLLESISFPSGKHMLVRAVISGLKTTPAAALSEMDLFLEHKASREHEEQIAKVLAEATGEWLVFFRDALAQISEEFPLPKTIFYTADGDVAEWYARAITEKLYPDRDDIGFSLKFLGTDLLKAFVATDPTTHADPFLEIETLFAKKYLGLQKKS
jgi:hypothetical protein